MRERRCFMRVPIGLEMTYQVGGQFMPLQLGMTEDLSQEGIRISQPEKLPTGSEVSLSFLLPTGGKLNIRGRVVWCAMKKGISQGLYQAGLRWIHIDTSSRGLLNAFLLDRVEPGASWKGIEGQSTDLMIHDPLSWLNLWRAIAFGALIITLGMIFFSFWLNLR